MSFYVKKKYQGGKITEIDAEIINDEYYQFITNKFKTESESKKYFDNLVENSKDLTTAIQSFYKEIKNQNAPEYTIRALNNKSKSKSNKQSKAQAQAEARAQINDIIHNSISLVEDKVLLEENNFALLIFAIQNTPEYILKLLEIFKKFEEEIIQILNNNINFETDKNIKFI